MSIRLRGHHLLCLLTYRGDGYSPAFVANFDRIVARLRGGEMAELVEGPDDICIPLLLRDGGEAHCILDRIGVRDRQALKAVSACLGREVAVGDHLALDEATVRRLRAAFAAGGSLRSACAGCEWNALCTAIATNPPGFDGARLCSAGW